MEHDSTVRQSRRDAFLDYLLQTPMDPEQHRPCRKSVLKVSTDDPLRTVMRQLTTEGFSSAPVLENGDFVGFIEMMDIVRFVQNLFWGATQPEWVDFWNSSEEFARATVGDVMESRRTTQGKLQKARYFALDDKIFANDSVLHALEIMSKGDIHRVGILSNRFDRKLCGIFTQSMLISEIRQRMALVGSDLKGKTVNNLTAWWTDIQTVSENERAINAFSTMAEQNITGLAVVNSNGVLVDNLSLTDMKAIGFSGESFWKLFQTIKDFKAYVRADHPFVAPVAHFSLTRTPKRTEPVYVTPSSTFEDVINHMEDGNIHRVFVCTDASAAKGRPLPTHVITQTDVLKYILQQYTWTF